MRNTLPQLRSEKEITQQELADALGISRQTVISIEKGHYEPRLRLAIRIARHFGKTVEEVFHDDTGT